MQEKLSFELKMQRHILTRRSISAALKRRFLLDSQSLSFNSSICFSNHTRSFDDISACFK